MFKRAKKYLTLQMLAATEPRRLARLSEEHALATFRRAAARIPAYRAFLGEHHVDPDTIRTIEDFRAGVPLLDKGKAFLAHRDNINTLCLPAELANIKSIVPSSGHTGFFSYGLTTRAEIKKNQEAIDFILDYVFEVASRRTLLINALPMGVRVHSDLVTIADTSVRSDIVLGLIRSFAGTFDQIILVAMNAFAKLILEDGLSQGIDWKRTPMHVVVGEELLSENLRSYMADILGINPDDPEEFRLIGSSFGVAEFGLNLFYETRELIRLRRLLQREPKLKDALIGREPHLLPALFYYNPMRLYAENMLTPDGSSPIILTNIEKDVLLPLIRYNIRDEGLIIPFNKLKETLESLNYAAFIPRVRLPLVAVWGRDKLFIEKEKRTLRPEQMKEILYEDPAIASCITGNFHLSIARFGGLRVEIQSKPDCSGQQDLEQRLREIILKYLPGSEIILYPYAEFPYGMTLDYERKFRYLPPAPPEPC